MARNWNKENNLSPELVENGKRPRSRWNYIKWRPERQ